MTRHLIVYYDPDDPQPLNNEEAEILLVLLHRYFAHETEKEPGHIVVEDVIDDLAMSMTPTTDLADRIRRDLGA